MLYSNLSFRVGDAEKPGSRAMVKAYVDKENGYRVKDTRVSLDSLVYAFWRGETPESIAQSFPVLNLEQVYGSLAYYLANKQEVDSYLKEAEGDYEALRQRAQVQDPMFYQKLRASRKEAA